METGDYVIVTRTDGTTTMARYRGMGTGLAVNGERVAWIELGQEEADAQLAPARSIRLATPTEIAEYIGKGDYRDDE